MVMETSSSHGVGSSERPSDFRFGFDNINFSDRTLVLEITDNHDPDDNHNRKRPRYDLLNHAIGKEAARDNEASPDSDFLPVRVKTIHVSSLILAKESQFFYKLFTNGMKESEQRHVTLRIEASEEVSFMDLLNYMYSDSLPRTSLFPLLDLVVTADKFEVASCVKYCSRLLQNLPMTCESALLYLDLPSSLLMSHTIRPLIDAAKQFLAAHFKDVERFMEEVLKLPLSGIEAILSSDDLQIDSEYAVYALVLKWAHKHYPELEERQGILKTHLLHLVRFPLMTSGELKYVLNCNEIDRKLAYKIVLDALFVKAETAHRQRCLTAKEGHQLVQRAYKYRPVRVIEFELPHQQSIVYLDLKREEVTHVFPDGHICSTTFHLGGQELMLCGRCILDKRTNIPSFGLYLAMKVAGSAAYTVSYEIASRMKPSGDFVSQPRSIITFKKVTGSTGSITNESPSVVSSYYVNFFGVSWTDFIANGSPYFINGILHLRVDMTMRS